MTSSDWMMISAGDVAVMMSPRVDVNRCRSGVCKRMKNDVDVWRRMRKAFGVWGRMSFGAES